MYKIKSLNGVVDSWILGEAEEWENAPNDFSPENYTDWIVIDGEWVRDAEKAALARNKQPFESWTWNSETFNWEPPVEMPQDGESYEWDEDSTSWKLVEAE